MDGISKIFELTCDPVTLGGEDLSNLLWADDLVLLSTSPEGLQSAISKTHCFYNDLGLEMNSKKTKIMIFNSRGIKITKHNFFVGNQPLEVVEEYQYLGIKLKPSGSFKFAVSELFDKANRAWFAISNVLYQHKKIAVKKALQLFDSLIRPIILYAVELWLPFIMPKKGLENESCLFKFWENFQPKVLNQKIGRLVLSVHRKCSRLAVLGELGRFPVLIPAIKLCLKYQYQIGLRDTNSLVFKALKDMKNNPEIDSWFSRVEKIKSALKIPKLYGKPEKVGSVLDKTLKGKFERFLLDEINVIKKNNDGLDHNKLRLYKTFKGCFKEEPYIKNILNRNQRMWLSRYRTSAHNLRIESGRYSSPITPLSQRVCFYCNNGEIDNEQHAILQCNTFKLKRQCFLARVAALHPDFISLTKEQQLVTILSPASTELAKCVSKYLGILSKTRSEIDNGLDPEKLNIYLEHRNPCDTNP